MGRISFRVGTRRYAFLLFQAHPGAGATVRYPRLRPACVISRGFPRQLRHRVSDPSAYAPKCAYRYFGLIVSWGRQRLYRSADGVATELSAVSGHFLVYPPYAEDELGEKPDDVGAQSSADGLIGQSALAPRRHDLVTANAAFVRRRKEVASRRPSANRGNASACHHRERLRHL